MAVEAERLIVSLEASVSKFERALAKANGTANKRARSIEQRFQQTNSALAAFGRSAFAPLIAGATAALAPIALVRKALDTIGEASQIGKVADKVGVATEELQRLRYGFDLTGVAVAQTDTAMQRFSRRVAEAANGGGELYRILKENGVQLRNQDGSMRSQVDILRDYANLVKNAGSEQERLLLAFKAFDTEGAGLVNALKGGADGLDKLMGKADEAGGVIEDELIRRAEELNDRWDAAWRTWEISAKSAILGASDAFVTWKDETIKGWSDIFRIIAGQGDQVRIENRIGKVFDEARQKLSRGDIELQIALREKYGQKSPAQRTVIPTGGSGSTAKTSDLDRSIALIRERTAALQATTAAQASLNPLIDDYGYAVERAAAVQELLTAAQHAGIAVTPELRAKIDALATGYATASVEAQKLAEDQGRIAQAANDMRDLGREALGGFIRDLRSGTSAADALSNALGRVADRLLDMALNNLFSPGGFGFGGTQTTLPPINLLQPRASGGPVQAGRAYLVGEKGPEPFIPAMSGTILPHAALKGGDGGGTVVNVINQASGTETEQRKRMSGSREIVDVIVKRVGQDYGLKRPATRT